MDFYKSAKPTGKNAKTNTNFPNYNNNTNNSTSNNNNNNNNAKSGNNSVPVSAAGNLAKELGLTKAAKGASKKGSYNATDEDTKKKKKSGIVKPDTVR
jgi:hypothetical protein